VFLVNDVWNPKVGSFDTSKLATFDFFNRINHLKNFEHKVALVILNYNGRQHLETFLPSVVRYSSDFPIFLADNASTDDSLGFVRSSYPEIEIIVNESNGGFAKGYNDALQHVDAEYYVLINSDVEVTKNWLIPLVEFMDLDATRAGCQPLIQAHLDPSKFEHAGAAGGFLDKNYYPFCRGRIFDQIENASGQYNDTCEIFWATGACMMIRSECFKLVGGFDASFFAHMEEIDLCWRLKRLGYSFHAIGNSVVYHLGGGTLNYMSPKKTFLNFRNSLFMITKNHEGIILPMIIKRLILDGFATIPFLLSGQFSHIWALLQAHISFYKYLPEMIEKRKAFIREHDNHFNRAGMYKKSIILDRFLFRKTKFNDLNSSDFY